MKTKKLVKSNVLVWIVSMVQTTGALLTGYCGSLLP